jgi:hypothetical protein
MKEVRAIKIEKYMEIMLDDSIIKDKLNIKDVTEVYSVGIDFSIDANIFYGVKSGNTLYESCNISDFENYDVILRLLNWDKFYTDEHYYFRVLKSNNNEVVNFREEKEYLKWRLI